MHALLSLILSILNSDWLQHAVPFYNDNKTDKISPSDASLDIALNWWCISLNLMLVVLHVPEKAGPKNYTNMMVLYDKALYLIATLFTYHYQKTEMIFINKLSRYDFICRLPGRTIFAIFLLSGWLTTHKAITKSCKIALPLSFTFEVITLKIFNEMNPFLWQVIAKSLAFTLFEWNNLL